MGLGGEAAGRRRLRAAPARSRRGPGPPCDVLLWLEATSARPLLALYSPIRQQMRTGLLAQRDPGSAEAPRERREANGTDRAAPATKPPLASPRRLPLHPPPRTGGNKSRGCRRAAGRAALSRATGPRNRRHRPPLSTSPDLAGLCFGAATTLRKALVRPAAGRQEGSPRGPPVSSPPRVSPRSPFASRAAPERGQRDTSSRRQRGGGAGAATSRPRRGLRGTAQPAPPRRSRGPGTGRPLPGPSPPRERSAARDGRARGTVTESHPFTPHSESPGRRR